MSEMERLDHLCSALETEVEELMEENTRLKARIDFLENRDGLKAKLSTRPYFDGMSEDEESEYEANSAALYEDRF